MFHVYQCDKFKDFGADEGKTGACDGGMWTGVDERGCPSQWGLPRTEGSIQKKKRARELSGKREMRRGLCA